MPSSSKYTMHDGPADSAVGTSVGVTVGCSVGNCVGSIVGGSEGHAVGDLVGATDGGGVLITAAAIGSDVIGNVGSIVGYVVGSTVGMRVGKSVGGLVGSCVGELDGRYVGENVTVRNCGFALVEQLELQSDLSSPLIPPEPVCEAASAKISSDAHTANVQERKGLSARAAR